jgi:hypothetical protein
MTDLRAWNPVRQDGGDDDDEDGEDEGEAEE